MTVEKKWNESQSVDSSVQTTPYLSWQDPVRRVCGHVDHVAAAPRTDRRAKLGRTCGRMTGRTDRRAAVQWTMYSTLQEPDSLSCQQTVTRRERVVGLHHSFLVRVSDTISLPIRRNQDVHTWRGCWLLDYPNIQIYVEFRPKTVLRPPYHFI